MKSMTGYGRAKGMIGQRQVVAEIRCYNHRYTDIRLKLPKGWMALEITAEKLIRERIGRGRVECLLRSASGSPSLGTPVLDRDCAVAYLQAYRELAEEIWKESGVQETPGFDLVARADGVVTVNEMIINAESAKQQMQTLVETALDEVDTMRKAEGDALGKELDKILSGIEKMVEKIEVDVPKEQALSIDKMKERIGSLAGVSGVSDERLAQEIAVMADRMDTSEELARLRSHFAQIHVISERTAQPVGRELDFLIQEINREVNTLLSKLISTKLKSFAVSLKAEVEKLREQVQNVE